MSNRDRNSAKANYIKTKILALLESLLEVNYNKKLTPDEHFILSCLLGEMDYEQIATVHGRTKPNRIETITDKLLEQLSDCLGETISVGNFGSVMEKHYQASIELKETRRGGN